MGVRRARGADLGLELGHALAGEVFDFEQIDGDPAVISPASPLGVLIRSKQILISWDTTMQHPGTEKEKPTINRVSS